MKPLHTMADQLDNALMVGQVWVPNPKIAPKSKPRLIVDVGVLTKRGDPMPYVRFSSHPDDLIDGPERALGYCMSPYHPHTLFRQWIKRTGASKTRGIRVHTLTPPKHDPQWLERKRTQMQRSMDAAWDALVKARQRMLGAAPNDMREAASNHYVALRAMSDVVRNCEVLFP